MLLQLYPHEHREQFGAEMNAVFKAALNEQRGWLERLWFCAREFAGLIAGAGVEHLRRGPIPAEEPSANVSLQTQIEANLRCMEHAIAHHRFEEARSCSWYDLQLRDQLRQLYSARR